MLQFATDGYFHIGHTHLGIGQPCQDYTLSGLHNDAAFAIVSDGCSTGGLTDVGSRLIVLSTASAIREQWAATRAIPEDTVLEIGARQKVTLSSHREPLGLTWSDMLATSLYAHMTPQGGLVHLQGDGVYAYKQRTGRIVMVRYEWADNIPFYPAYSNDVYKHFIQAHGGDVDVVRLKGERWEYTPGGEFNQLDDKVFTISEGIRGITKLFTAGELEALDCVAVYSDGVAQIEGLDWMDAVVQSLAFKVTTGEFAKRRMIRMIKDSQRTGKGPLDDIAYAVVRVIPSELERGERCDDR